MNGSSSSSASPYGGSSGSPSKPLISAIPTRLQQQHAPRTSTTSEEPTIQQLLAQTSIGGSHSRTTTDGSDVGGVTSGLGMASWRKGQGFKAWESELLKSGEVRRKADVAQLCECGYVTRILLR